MEENKTAVDEALAGVEALYTGNLAEHGLTSKSVGWKDEESQLLRFDKLLSVVDDGGAGFTVNDWGCGYGAMLAHMDSKPDLVVTSYRGYDISEEMLAAARKQAASPRATFVQSSSIDQDADYTFVSGTFNVKMAASDEEWTKWVEDRLLELAAVSKKGLAFNLLSSFVDWKQDNLFYADPMHFFDFCKRRLSRYVALLHDYPLYEWTILVKKEN